MDASDQLLLTQFRRKRCQRSFEELVRRHAPMVIATARRVLGDSHRAEDVAQTVFLVLARRANHLRSDGPIGGWLYLEARHRALDLARSDTRRIHREQVAAVLHAGWPPENDQDLSGVLESVLNELPRDERDLLILRYLEDRRLTEVGIELGISEHAAQKRIARALERLRALFTRRGVALGSGAIASLLAGEAGAAVPMAFISNVTSTAVGLASATVAATTLSTAMNALSLKTSAAIVSVALLTGATTYWIKDREVDRLRADLQAKSAAESGSTEATQQAEAVLKIKDQQIAQLRRDLDDLPRLRGEVNRLNRELAQFAGSDAGAARKLPATESRPDAATAAVQNDEPVDFSKFVSRNQWRNAGLATPEDTIMTLQWAAMNKDVEAVLAASSYTAEVRELVRESMTKSGSKGEDIRAEAIRIVAQIPSGTKMLVQVEERMADGSRLRRPVTLIQEPDGWKVTVTDLGAGVVGGRARNGR